MKLNIDLGSKDGGCCSPMSMPDKDEMHYPSFHYDGKEELDLPKEGEMVIRYREVSSSTLKSDTVGKRYSCTIEVREIVSVKGSSDSAPAKNYGKDTEDALDKLKADAEEDYEK